MSDLSKKVTELETQVKRIADVTGEVLERVNTLANLAATLVDCIGELTLSEDREIKLSIATKLGAFALSEKRETD